MSAHKTKTHTDSIWVSLPREIHTVEQFSQVIHQQGWTVVQQDSNNYGHPYVYQRGQQRLHCRFVDSVFMSDPTAWQVDSTVITDNIPLRRMTGTMLSVIPEFWHIWRFDPAYVNRPATWAYNCFMNRPRGDRSIVFYELIRRNILDQGLVSFNVDPNGYDQQFEQLGLAKYTREHELGSQLIPYNNLAHSLDQCIIDSRVSLVMETYSGDSHLVFSEKIFRCLQIPRPWLLFCSPGAVSALKAYGFDVLDEYVDHGYDSLPLAHQRLNHLIRQLEDFVDRQYSDTDYKRFQQAAQHNRQRLDELAGDWPARLSQVLQQVRDL
jgi:hypothetical protein